MVSNAGGLALSASEEADGVSRWGRLGAIFLAVALLTLIVAFVTGPWPAHERVNPVYTAVERILIIIGFLFLALSIYFGWKGGYLHQDR